MNPGLIKMAKFVMNGKYARYLIDVAGDRSVQRERSKRLWINGVADAVVVTTARF
jgi:hypothetical protein